MGDDGGLPGFSVFDRQSLMREALGLDEPGLSAKDVELAERRPEAGSFIRRSAS